MDGNLGSIGLALMTSPTAALPAAPTITLRVKQFADPMPQFIETEEDIATGTRFGRQKFIQGIQSGNRQIQASATLKDLPLLLTALLGAPAANVITPRPGAFAPLAPGQPVAVWQKHPLKNSVFPAAQIGGVTITIASRQNADLSVTLNTARVDPMATVPVFPPLAADGIFQFMNWYVLIGGKKYAPESGTIEITQGMAAEDGAQGLDDAAKMGVIGWSLDGPLIAKLTFVISESGAQVDTGTTLVGLVGLATPSAAGVRTTQLIETGFKIGTADFKFSFPNAALMSNNIPTGLGRLTVGFEAQSQNLGAAPVTVSVPVIV